MKFLNYQNDVAEAPNSDELMKRLKIMLHDMFSAEYVIVFITPEEPSQKIGYPEDVNIQFVRTSEQTELPEPVRDKPLGKEDKSHRYIPAEEITRTVLDELLKLANLNLEGYDEIILNFTLENRYLGFISLHKKGKFTKAEKRRLKALIPFITLVIRLANHLSLTESLSKYALRFIINNLVQNYDLTPSEEFVIHKLVRGYDLKEIARERGTTIHAIRKIVRSIYKKVGVQRRAELLAKIFEE